MSHRDAGHTSVALTDGQMTRDTLFRALTIGQITARESVNTTHLGKTKSNQVDVKR